jgi:hypothetical protein
VVFFGFSRHLSSLDAVCPFPLLRSRPCSTPVAQHERSARLLRLLSNTFPLGAGHFPAQVEALMRLTRPQMTVGHRLFHVWDCTKMGLSSVLYPSIEGFMSNPASEKHPKVNGKRGRVGQASQGSSPTTTTVPRLQPCPRSLLVVLNIASQVDSVRTTTSFTQLSVYGLSDPYPLFIISHVFVS